MYLKIFGYSLLIIIVALIDIAFISGLPFGLHRLHLLLLALVFVLLLSNVRLAAWWIIGGAFMFELFSFKIFGTYFFVLTATAGLMYLLFERVITNRSLYAVGVVTGSAVLFYDGLILWYDYAFQAVALPSLPDILLGQAAGLGLNITLAIVIFYLSSVATRRLRPVFLPGRSTL